MFIQCPRLTTAAAISAITALATTATASGQQVQVMYEAQKLLASDGAAGDGFGTAIAREGDTLIIGAPQHFTNALPGSFYVFTRDAAPPGGVWNQQARVFGNPPPQSQYGDLFGQVLALQGDTLLVGAPFTEVNGTFRAGMVYVLTRPPNASGTWVHHQTLLPNDPDTPPGGDFGTRIALVGDTAVITGLRRVFVFTRNGAGVWSQQTSMRPFANGGAGGIIRNLAFDGQRIALTEYPSNDLRTAIFTASPNGGGGGGGWGDPIYLLHQTGGEQASTGACFCGEQFALGATDFNGLGRVILFGPDGKGDWSPGMTLMNPDPQGPYPDIHGFGAAIHGGTSAVVIGAPFVNRAFVFLPQGAAPTDWTYVAQLRPSDANIWAHNFGSAVHVRDNVAVVGSSAHHQNGLYSGAVYVFDPIPLPVPGDVTGDGAVNVDDLLAVIAAWGPCSAPPAPGSCPADISPPPNGNGVVNVDDLLMVISNWGG